MKNEPVHHNELKTGTKYLIDGFEYTYDGYSTFWNLRMCDERGKLTVFPQKTKVYNSQSSKAIK